MKADVVIIGGGHNGLVAAALLARGGLKPLVLERRDILGGASVTEEFHPGFKASTVAHMLGPLRASVVEDLDLKNRGLGFVEAGLVGTLTVAGVASADALAATLLYRIVSYWLPLPAGGVAYVLFRRRYPSR